jgi:hypothetical protein
MFLEVCDDLSLHFIYFYNFINPDLQKFSKNSIKNFLALGSVIVNLLAFVPSFSIDTHVDIFCSEPFESKSQTSCSVYSVHFPKKDFLVHNCSTAAGIRKLRQQCCYLIYKSYSDFVIDTLTS